MKFRATPTIHTTSHDQVSDDTQHLSIDSDLIVKSLRVVNPGPGTVYSNFRLLSHFIIHGSLSSGANGQVWAATFVPTGQIYAIKVVSVVDGSKKACQALYREANMLFRASTISGAARAHLSIYDTRSAIFVTDLYRAGSLAHFLMGKGRITCRQSVYYLQQLLKIVERFHADGIVHGDITPENLLIEDDGTLALGNMGAALSFNVPDHLARLEPDARADSLVQLTPLSAIGGTPAFMAPEIWRREGYGPAVDYWAAVLCYFVIRTGRINPWGKTADEMILGQEETSSRICEGNITILPEDGFNPVEKSFFKLTLDKDLKQRLTPSQIKDHTLFRIYGSDWNTIATPPFRPDLDAFVLEPSKSAMDVLRLAMPKIDDLVDEANLNWISDDFSSSVNTVFPTTYTSETPIKEAQFNDTGALTPASPNSSSLVAPEPASPCSSDCSILEFNPFQSCYSPDSSTVLTTPPSSPSGCLTPDCGSSTSVTSDDNEKQDGASPTQMKLVSSMTGMIKKRSGLRVRFLEIDEFQPAYSSGNFQASLKSPASSSLLFRVDSDYQSSPISSSPCPQKRTIKSLPKMMMTKMRAESAQSSDRTLELPSPLPIHNVSTNVAQPRSKAPVKKALPRAVFKPVSALPIISKASTATTIPQDQTPQVNTNNRTSKKKTIISTFKPALKPLTLVGKYFPDNEMLVSPPIKHDRARSSSPSRVVLAQSSSSQTTTGKLSSPSISSGATSSSPSRTNKCMMPAASIPTPKRTHRTPVKFATNTSAWAAKPSSSPKRVSVEVSAWNVMPLAWKKASPVAANPRAGIWY